MNRLETVVSMTCLRPPFVTAVLVSVGLVTACASSRKPATGTADTSADVVMETRADARAIAKVRADSLRYPYTVADIRFMSGMIVHHSQAVTMSALAPKRAASSSVKILAERIMNAQNDEMESVRRWLRDRRQPIPHDMSANGEMHEMPMPGMISKAQLDQLERATGPEFDRLFLTLMIQHHRGAVEMVKDLFATDGAAQDERVFKFASDVNVDQITEIARMERMLGSLTPGQP